MRHLRSTQGSVVTAIAVATGLLAITAGCAPVADEVVVSAPVVPTATPNRLNTDSLALLSQTITPPLTVVVADLGIDMAIEPHGLDDEGQMALPDTPMSAAWYEYGAAPDSVQGSTVIAAHVDSRVYGVGPFARLRDAKPGMTVTVSDEAGVVHTYSVTSVERIPKSEVPLDQVFSAVGDPRLVLITCGGAFLEEVRNYTDNYIVTAEKVS